MFQQDNKTIPNANQRSGLVLIPILLVKQRAKPIILDAAPAEHSKDATINSKYGYSPELDILKRCCTFSLVMDRQIPIRITVKKAKRTRITIQINLILFFFIINHAKRAKETPKKMAKIAIFPIRLSGGNTNSIIEERKLVDSEMRIVAIHSDFLSNTAVAVPPACGAWFLYLSLSLFLPILSHLPKSL